PLDGWEPPIVPAVAIRDQGIAEVAAAVERHRAHLHASGQLAARDRERAGREFQLIIQEAALEQLRARYAGAAWGAMVDQIAVRIQGWDSEPIMARGRWQADRAGQRLAAAGLAALYASPLRRASETAEIIGRVAGLDVVLLDGLREMNTGRVSGLHSAQFLVRHPRLWWGWLRDDVRLAFPGGD